MKWLSVIASQSIKLIVALVFFLLASNVQLRANPIVVYPPDFFVSELAFDSSGKWVIELNSLSFDLPETVDSVRISTSSGSAKWKNITFVDDEGYPVQQDVFVLRSDSLDSDLSIRREGDLVQVTTYYKEPVWNSNGDYGDSLTHTLVFGNYSGATVRSPREGESIIYISDYVVDWNYDDMFKSRAVPCYSNLYAIATGYPNERNVCTGNIRARIYDSNNQPFSESGFQYWDDYYSKVFEMVRQSDGIYAGNAYACYYHLSKLHKWVDQYAGAYYTDPHTGYYYHTFCSPDYWTIDPIQFEIEQDTIIYLDIYIKEYVNPYANIQTVKKEEDHILKIYPNPIINNSFDYETTLPVKSTNSIIEITGLNGQKIGQYPVLENKGKITLAPNIVAGIYTVSLIVNNKNYANTKIVVP